MSGISGVLRKASRRAMTVLGDVDWEYQRVYWKWRFGFVPEIYGKLRYLHSAQSVGRRPVVIGDPAINASRLTIGDDFKVWSAHRKTVLTGPGEITIGDRCFINVGSTVISVKSITIGHDVALANEVLIFDSNSHGIEGGPIVTEPVIIGDGCWLGNRSMVLPGVTLGRRVMVAAGSVVTRDVPDDSLVAGNPARVIRTLNYPDYCQRAWCDQSCICDQPDRSRDATSPDAG